LKEWCLATHADIIFFTGAESGFSHYVTWKIAKFLNIPIVTYFMDDYLLYPKYKTFLSKIQHFRMKFFYKKTIQRSSKLFCIGELMAQEYGSHFNREFIPVMNSVDVKDYVPMIKFQSQIVISYFGALHLNRWSMIARLGKLLPINTVIHVYSITPLTTQIEEEFLLSNVAFKGVVDGEELEQKRLLSDYLLHVESDDDYCKSLTRLSVSTKIPEYLISGRPVIAFGPPEVASMRLLSDNNVGIVISSYESNEEIERILALNISNHEAMQKMGKRANEYAKVHFNKLIVANNVKEKILSIK
jgi:glycosyltransferase involved in cell wall biosynthesis